jgi:hypothetical protein
MRGVNLLGEMSEWTIVLEKMDSSSCTFDYWSNGTTSCGEDTPSAHRIWRHQRIELVECEDSRIILSTSPQTDLFILSTRRGYLYLAECLLWRIKLTHSAMEKLGYQYSQAKELFDLPSATLANIHLTDFNDNIPEIISSQQARASTVPPALPEATSSLLTSILFRLSAMAQQTGRRRLSSHVKSAAQPSSSVALTPHLLSFALHLLELVSTLLIHLLLGKY